MQVALTKANAARLRRLCGNRVYAAEHALPERWWRRESQTDLAAIYWACVGPEGPPLNWVRGGRRGQMFGDYSRVNIGTHCAIWVPVHEAAHVHAGGAEGHNQNFVTCYVRLLDEHAPPSLARALKRRLAWQDFDVSGYATA